VNVGNRLTVRIEKPAAGGRMIARHDGAVLLVLAAIPGEEVEVEVEKVQRGTAWARTTRVVTPSPDRVVGDEDWACGGNVYSHIRYERQLDLKRDIIRDALMRIGRLTPPSEIEIAPSPIDGYRMRARFRHVDGWLGYFREGTHELCDPAPTRQLLGETVEALQHLGRALKGTGNVVREVELSENCAADQRAVHLVLRHDGDPSRLGGLVRPGEIAGISYSIPGGRPLTLDGDASVSDTFSAPPGHESGMVVLRRQAHAFFQGNRFLLPTLVGAVNDVVPDGSVLDLYAGVGLFAVTLGARRGRSVVAIEGDRVSAYDLKTNAAQCHGRVHARHQSVEAFLAGGRRQDFDTVIVDPPRTGMTKEALSGAVALRASRVVYVSCDVATLGRDARILVDAGYRLTSLRAFDLFPNTAHVESLAVFDRT
jgi:23S rRNA (uracil1939-C5)-methyltransferase